MLSFKIFWAIRGYRIESMTATIVWSFIYSVCFLFLFMSFLMNGFELVMHIRLTALLLSVSCLFRIYFIEIRTVFQFLYYIIFLQKISFNITGLNELLHYPFINDETWIKSISITIKLKNEKTFGEEERIKYKIHQFYLKANAVTYEYYEQESLNWSLSENQLSATGGLNQTILGMIFRLIYFTLSAFKAIESVTILYKPTTSIVSRVSSEI